VSRIAFVTSEALSNLTEDDRRAAEALARRGAAVTPVVWTKSPRLDRFDAVVIRSPWDYSQQPRLFDDWLEAARSAPLLNSYEVLRWNVDKRYLTDLAAAGASVIPTLVYDRYARVNLEAIVRDRGWSRVVVKPLISAAGNRTFTAMAGDLAAAQAELAVLLADVGVLIQPFAEGIADEGEWSLIYLGGEYSHCVLKRTAADDFRVQAKWGGTVGRAEPGAAVIEAAERALAAAGAILVDADLLYARVDLVRCNGVYSVMELELIEPELFFRFAEESADRFADALLSRLRGKRTRRAAPAALGRPKDL